MFNLISKCRFNILIYELLFVLFPRNFFPHAMLFVWSSVIFSLVHCPLLSGICAWNIILLVLSNVHTGFVFLVINICTSLALDFCRELWQEPHVSNSSMSYTSILTEHKIELICKVPQPRQYTDPFTTSWALVPRNYITLHHNYTMENWKGMCELGNLLWSYNNHCGKLLTSQKKICIEKYYECTFKVQLVFLTLKWTMPTWILQCFDFW
jgi:hypothetical protein